MIRIGAGTNGLYAGASKRIGFRHGAGGGILGMIGFIFMVLAFLAFLVLSPVVSLWRSKGFKGAAIAWAVTATTAVVTALAVSGPATDPTAHRALAGWLFWSTVVGALVLRFALRRRPAVATA